MATLTVKMITLGENASTGVYSGVSIADAALTAVTGAGDSWAVGNADRTFLIFQNTNLAAAYVKISSAKRCDQGHLHNIGDASASVAIAASTGRVILGPFKREQITGANGDATINYGGTTTDLKVAVCELAAEGR